MLVKGESYRLQIWHECSHREALYDPVKFSEKGTWLEPHEP